MVCSGALRKCLAIAFIGPKDKDGIAIERIIELRRTLPPHSIVPDDVERCIATEGLSERTIPIEGEWLMRHFGNVSSSAVTFERLHVGWIAARQPMHPADNPFSRLSFVRAISKVGHWSAAVVQSKLAMIDQDEAVRRQSGRCREREGGPLL